jgi:drug/metabolite transporter (DMT)-like permease
MPSIRGSLPIGIFAALAAAALFGASTPLAKVLLASVSPWMLASLLYLGSGIGLSACALLLRRGGRSAKEAPLGKRDAPWLAGAVLFGGVCGPVLLMYGLRTTAASTGALLLNLESVLTAAIAWLVLRENVDRRVFLGMVAIVAGGALLSLSPAGGVSKNWLGPLAIAGACLCWAIDNNLTRAVSGGDPLQVAAIKGWVAGATNLALALALGQAWPAIPTLALALLLGFTGYGLSLALFVRALRDLGAARTGAYFSTAPFVGAAIAVLWLAETPSAAFWIAGALMALGVWLHLSETHEHEHAHEAMAHEHAHVHDEHHQHAHDFAWDGEEPHSHAHRHEPMRHAHPHFPDLHHRHDHG